MAQENSLEFKVGREDQMIKTISTPFFVFVLSKKDTHYGFEKKFVQ